MQDTAVGNGWPAFTDARFWPRLNGLRFAAGRSAPIPSADFYALASAGGDHNAFVAPDGSIEREAARNFGVDFTYPLTRTTTLVATAAPDFSNVEVDQQTTAPQEFSRQLKEYRPVFAQGAGFISAALGADENVTLSIRAINGNGGYAAPGVNIAAAYHKRYRNGNDLYVNFGTPAATQTLHRLIVKYVLHVGPLRT